MDPEVSMETQNPAGSVAYWAFVVFLIAFGFLGILTTCRVRSPTTSRTLRYRCSLALSSPWGSRSVHDG